MELRNVFLGNPILAHAHVHSHGYVHAHVLDTCGVVDEPVKVAEPLSKRPSAMIRGDNRRIHSHRYHDKVGQGQPIETVGAQSTGGSWDRRVSLGASTAVNRDRQTKNFTSSSHIQSSDVLVACYVTMSVGLSVGLSVGPTITFFGFLSYNGKK